MVIIFNSYKQWEAAMGQVWTQSRQLPGSDW